MSNPPRPYNLLDARIQAIVRKDQAAPSKLTSKPSEAPHLRVSVDFLSRCAHLIRSRDALLLYMYMYLRSAPTESKRQKCADLYGDLIHKGEFFEGKHKVAASLGKGHIKNKSKINWFGRTVKPLVELGLVKQIRVGRRGYNATFIVIDICELEVIKK